ncbi:MAG: ferrous iron transporter B [Firmicutes bacterium]|jgi:ferrous iron transport protein B|nr:ferrous iron transporter B [Bacillota bacterium]MDH7496683.1 nucleoside recognition domain-containing protein [Bacillota bacterium]
MSRLDTESFGDIVEAARKARSALQGDVRDLVVTRIYEVAEGICRRTVRRPTQAPPAWDTRLDDIVTSRLLGYPLMLALLGVVFWITLVAANVPSKWLGAALFSCQDRLLILFTRAGAPAWLTGITVMGAYRALAWVVSVMLPPVVIFFPCFALLEDLGYLPRVAFNLDAFFRGAGAHGKQALTMCMGFGCNAAGVVSCRIIESPRERIIAVLTNNFVPCNGRFPTLVAMSSVFFGAGLQGAAALSLLATVLLGVAVTLAVSWVLSRTTLRGVPSFFVLELPPYRKPQVVRVIIRALLDRALFVLVRAASVAAPVGALTWVLANSTLRGASLLTRLAAALEPFGRVIGLDGHVMTAFLLGLPANEIVIPVLAMAYTGAGAMVDPGGLDALRQLVTAHGWTPLTGVCLTLFSLLHYPCATTLWTIWHETRSAKWTALGALLPLTVACAACFLASSLGKLLGIAG